MSGDYETVEACLFETQRLLDISQECVRELRAENARLREYEKAAGLLAVEKAELRRENERLHAELTEARRQLREASEQVPSFWYVPALSDDDEDALVLPARDGKCPSSYATAGAIPLYAAPVPQPAVPEAVVKDAIPDGWVFYSADASIQAGDPRRPMAAMIKRDVDGVRWWLQLTEAEKEATPLYSSGTGMTLTLAIQNAVDAIMSAHKEIL